jgi:hypothetical protein
VVCRRRGKLVSVQIGGNDTARRPDHSRHPASDRSPSSSNLQAYVTGAYAEPIQIPKGVRIQATLQRLQARCLRRSTAFRDVSIQLKLLPSPTSALE